MLDYSNIMLDIINNVLDGYNGKAWLMTILGVSLCLIGAILMYHGKVLGENTIGYATVLGIFDIGIMTGSRR